MPQSQRITETRTRSRIIAAITGLCVCGILIALGVWQLQRRDWKNSLLARFETALQREPAAYNPRKPASPKEREFARVRVKGEFLNDDTMRLMTAAPDDVSARLREDFGYLLFTPLKFPGGIVFVNRGFVPLSLANSPELILKGETEVTGIVRLSQKPSWLTPPPNLAKHLFYGADIPAMAASSDLKGEAIEGEYIEAEPVAGAPPWPKARDPHVLFAAIPNDHLQYAITWFALAAAVVGFFGVYIVRG